jgi:hypothetical protein
VVFIYKWKHQTFRDRPASSVIMDVEGKGVEFSNEKRKSMKINLFGRIGQINALALLSSYSESYWYMCT